MRMPYEYEMMHEDFVVRRKWVRGLAVFYGCIGLGIIVIALTGGLVPRAGKHMIAQAPAVDAPAKPSVQSQAPSDAGAPAVERAQVWPASNTLDTAGPGIDISHVLADPAVRNFVGIAENGWNFNDPNTVPGFGPVTPVDVEKLLAHATGWTTELRVREAAAHGSQPSAR